MSSSRGSPVKGYALQDKENIPPPPPPPSGQPGLGLMKLSSSSSSSASSSSGSVKLPPIRDIHATPKPSNQSNLPPTPNTTRQDLNLITPIQPRILHQPMNTSTSIQGQNYATFNHNVSQTIPHAHHQSHSHSHSHSHPHSYMMTPHTIKPIGQVIQNNFPPSSILAFDEKHQSHQKDQNVGLDSHSARIQQTPCPRPSTSLAISSAGKKKLHPPNGTPLETPISKSSFNIGYSNAPPNITPLRTPVSVLSTRTMGRSISTPTFPMNALPMSAPYTLSNRSAASTRYSPSAESQRSSSVSRTGPRGRATSFSPSPTPSSPSPIELSGIQPPAAFPGPYPTAYTRKDPVPSDEGEPESENKRSGRQGAPSWNPWDYVLGEVPGGELGPNSTPVKECDDGKGNKIRRRFTKRELEALEVLWSITKSPSKYERQRLGAWLGVKTKHITVWFQNRRQEEKRYRREGAPVEPPPPSRSNRGTFDPVTGKWRPVPLSCISGLQPPPEEKSAVVRSISVGDLTRDMYFEAHPHSEAHLPTPTPASGRSYTTQDNVTPLPKRGMNSSLDNVLEARESEYGESRKRQYRRASGDVLIRGEGQDKHRELLALIPSDPPSMDLSEFAIDEDNDEEEEEEEENDSPKRKPLGSNGGAMGLDRMLNGPSTAGLGRAASLDILASAPRTKGKYWSLKSNSNNNGPLQPRSMNSPLGAINPNIPNKRPILAPLGEGALKRSASPFSQTIPPKRARIDGSRHRPTSTFKHKDSDLRSRNSAVLESPTTSSGKDSNSNNDKDERGEMKTPGFTRSFSFSSNMSDGVAITPDNAVLARKRSDENNNDKQTKDATEKQKERERDAEVLGAAEKLLQLLGGA
ncbi:uncharacterized protein IL334_003490 [Kwoniella shivajii]|uniref:Homeobox domain-containing protein n=1 Tax=Kwoniella shivajii TaxID=564305 RepID=A0ABZ1D0N7_9TREE|nr:hypothetical protein IL334_003490 [Kwoniella shivajii]